MVPPGCLTAARRRARPAPAPGGRGTAPPPFTVMACPPPPRGVRVESPGPDNRTAAASASQYAVRRRPRALARASRQSSQCAGRPAVRRTGWIGTPALMSPPGGGASAAATCKLQWPRPASPRPPQSELRYFSPPESSPGAEARRRFREWDPPDGHAMPAHRVSSAQGIAKEREPGSPASRTRGPDRASYSARLMSARSEGASGEEEGIRNGEQHRDSIRSDGNDKPHGQR